MISKITPEKLKQTDIDHDANHLADVMRYVHLADTMRYVHLAFMHLPKQESYVCECKHCNLTHYTSYKRLNCEYCGCDSDQFICRELK